MTQTSPQGTPKRKRNDLITERLLSTPNHPARNIFSFQPPGLHPMQPSTHPGEDGNSSPRSKVAQKLGDLALENTATGGGGVLGSIQAHRGHHAGAGHDGDGDGPPHDRRPKFSPELSVFDFLGNNSHDDDGAMQLDNDDEDAARKRARLPEVDNTSFHPSARSEGEARADAAGPVQIDQSGRLSLHSAVDPAVVKTSKSSAAGRLQKSFPSINRLADSKSRSRKRAGTPPLVPKRKSTADKPAEEEPPVDPIRASLTWHEDEITVYDPEDKDDDGTGINGIGFKPTPAIAYQRAQKRKQQLAEYKKRVESEARAQRSQRRKEQPERGQLERKHSMIRVHFSDAEPTTVLTT